MSYVGSRAVSRRTDKLPDLNKSAKLAVLVLTDAGYTRVETVPAEIKTGGDRGGQPPTTDPSVGAPFSHYVTTETAHLYKVTLRGRHGVPPTRVRRWFEGMRCGSRRVRPHPGDAGRAPESPLSPGAECARDLDAHRDGLDRRRPEYEDRRQLSRRRVQPF